MPHTIVSSLIRGPHTQAGHRIQDREFRTRGYAVRDSQGDVEIRDTLHRRQATIRERFDGTQEIRDTRLRRKATLTRPDVTGQRRVLDRNGRTVGFVRERNGRTEVLDKRRRPVASTGVLLD